MSKHADCFTNEVFAAVCWDTEHLTTVQMYYTGHRQQDNAKVTLLAKHKLAVHKMQLSSIRSGVAVHWGCRHETYAWKAVAIGTKPTGNAICL